jgi:hypothetical protein
LKPEESGTVTCPNCGQVLSEGDLYVFTLCREGIERDFYEWLGFSPWYVQWSGDKDLIARFGPHYELAHGWEPFFSYLLAVVASGVIGNAAYDLLKPLVKRLFERQFPHWCDSGINLDHHVRLVFDFLQANEPSERGKQAKKWILRAQTEQGVRSTGEPLSDAEIQAALEEVRVAFRRILGGPDSTPTVSQSDKPNAEDGG